MTIEEKAKAYDEAIVVAKSCLKKGVNPANNPLNYFIGCLCKMFPDSFPELTKIEDERVRKHIVKFIDEQFPTHGNLKEVKEKMLAYLEKRKEQDKCPEYCVKSNCVGCSIYEKQKEQKSTIFTPKFRVGDKVVSTKNPHLTYNIIEVGLINELGNPEYRVEILTDEQSDTPPNIKLMECQKMDSWGELIEQKPEELDELEKLRKQTHEIQTAYMKGIEVGRKEQKPVEWSKEDEANLDYLIDFCNSYYNGNTRTLTESIARTLSNWLYRVKSGEISLPERFNLQPKQEWSEEDEKMLNTLLSFFPTLNGLAEYNMILGREGDQVEVIDGCFDWLKSLRLQSKRRDTYYDIIHDILASLKEMDFTQITPEHRVSLLNDIRVKCKNADECAEILDESSWKPSEEQLEALKNIAYGSYQVGDGPVLRELYDNLKKL